MRFLPNIALILAIINGCFWRFFPKGSYYIINAIFVFLLACIVYYEIKVNSFLKFIIFEFALYSVIDEVFFDGAVCTLFDALILIITPFIWWLKNRL